MDSNINRLINELIDEFRILDLIREQKIKESYQALLKTVVEIDSDFAIRHFIDWSEDNRYLRVKRVILELEGISLIVIDYRDQPACPSIVQIKRLDSKDNPELFSMVVDQGTKERLNTGSGFITYEVMFEDLYEWLFKVWLLGSL